MQLASVPRIHLGCIDNFKIAAQAGPAGAGHSLIGIMVFAYPDNFITKRIIRHISMTAKHMLPRSCTSLHIPPTIRHNCQYLNTLPSIEQYSLLFTNLV